MCVCVCVCVIIFISTCLLGFLGLYSLLVLCVPLLPLPTLTHHPLLSSPHTLLHAPTHTHMTSLPIRVIAFHIVSIYSPCFHPRFTILLFFYVFLSNTTSTFYFSFLFFTMSHYLHFLIFLLSCHPPFFPSLPFSAILSTSIFQYFL